MRWRLTRRYMTSGFGILSRLDSVADLRSSVRRGLDEGSLSEIVADALLCCDPRDAYFCDSSSKESCKYDVGKEVLQDRRSRAQVKRTAM